MILSLVCSACSPRYAVTRVPLSSPGSNQEGHVKLGRKGVPVPFCLTNLALALCFSGKALGKGQILHICLI